MNWRPILTAAALMLIVTGLVVGVITPLLTENPGQPLTSLHRGRLMYVMISAWESEDPGGGWPAYGSNSVSFGFQDSTDYCRRLLEAGSNTLDYSFFSLRGLPSARTTNAAEFTSANNAWCITANVDEQTPDRTPVIFTRNISVTNTAQCTGPVAATLGDEPPYGRDVAVVVLRGGTVMNVRPDDTWETVLGNVAPGRLPVLRP